MSGDEGQRERDRGAQFIFTMTDKKEQVASRSSAQLRTSVNIKDHTFPKLLSSKKELQLEQLSQITKMSPNFLLFFL